MGYFFSLFAFECIRIHTFVYSHSYSWINLLEVFAFAIFWLILWIPLTWFANYESIIEVHVLLLLLLHNTITLLLYIWLVHYNHYWSIHECIHEYLAMYSYSHSNTLLLCVFVFAFVFMEKIGIRIRIRILIKCIRPMPAWNAKYPVSEEFISGGLSHTHTHTDTLYATHVSILVTASENQ